MHRFPLVAIAMSALGALAMTTAAMAGVGPENVLVVVNGRRSDSRTIANHYCQLRQIPPGNVLEIDWPNSDISCGVDAFRLGLLKPILETLKSRKLDTQIDCVAYSSGFPYSVNIGPDFPGEKKPMGSGGSLTGMTYLFRLAQIERENEPPLYVNMTTNWYMRRVDATTGAQEQPTCGFRAQYGWNAAGSRIPISDPRALSYMLSTMLGYTSGTGNSVEEVIDYLTKSAQADGTQPKGTIYYLKNTDIRSRVRESLFPKAIKELQQLGVRAVEEEGVLPQRKSDVQGAMIGFDKFSWASSRSEILPGAICEHFTSYGGIFNGDTGQTPLSELLRHGAAGASGTITEPMALANKFPHPYIHVHYARGATLAEAFYQSIWAPYQLLIVGDPLCRPWAKIPKIRVGGVKPNDVVKGTITLQPHPDPDNSVPISRYDLFVDGRRVYSAGPNQSIELNSAQLGDGHHELRVVAVEASPIESQGRIIIPIRVDNLGHQLTLSSAGGKVALADDVVRLRGSGPANTETIRVFHNRREVGTIKGAHGSVAVKASEFGEGPVRLLAVATLEGSADRVFAQPLELNIRGRSKSSRPSERLDVTVPTTPLRPSIK